MYYDITQRALRKHRVTLRVFEIVLLSTEAANLHQQGKLTSNDFENLFN